MHSAPLSTQPPVSVVRSPKPAPVAGHALQRVALAGASGLGLYRLRGGLMAAIRAQHHGVRCFAPVFEEQSEGGLRGLGAECREVVPPLSGFQVFAERRHIAALAEELAAYQPHVLIASSGAFGLLAVRAARRAKVRKIVVIVTEVPAKGQADRDVQLAGRMLALADLAVFHNGDDPKAMKARGLLPADLPYTVVPGGGVDLAHHGVQALPPFTAGLSFLMISRLDACKGAADFCAAARLVKERAPSARFILAGPPGQGPDAVSAEFIASFADAVTYVGALDDVRPLLGDCHVFVHPSRTEGMPRAVLEALAAGRPVITTNTPGCRDTVDERINGCLVPASDPEALAATIQTFLKRPDLIPSMARASRSKAERRFDARAVNATLLDVLGLV